MGPEDHSAEITELDVVTELDATVLHLPEGAFEHDVSPQPVALPCGSLEERLAEGQMQLPPVPQLLMGAPGAQRPTELGGAVAEASRPAAPDAAEASLAARAAQPHNACAEAQAFEEAADVEAEEAQEDGVPTDASSAGCQHASAEDAPAKEAAAEEADAEVLHLRKENSALVNQLCKAKAKFELTLETLRSMLHLEASAGWADVLERCEAVVQSSGADSNCSSPAPLAPTHADLEREQLEEDLEAQVAYNARLRELLQKQQHLLDMTAQLDWRNASERADELRVECDSLREQLHGRDEAISRQGAAAREQASRIAALEAELQEERRSSAASAEERRRQEAQDRRRQEAQEKKRRAADERLRAEAERKSAEVRELVDALSKQEVLVEHLQEQLQVHEAAERRRKSYHPGKSGNGLSEDAGSEFNSSIGSGRTSARGPTRSPSEQELPQRATPKPQPRPIEDMGKEERDAFLSHFPMSSRTERQLRNRLDDRRRRPGTGT